MGWVQLIVDGIALGAAYALVALGFVLILNAAGAVNFAQGDLVMAGGFAAVLLASLVPLGGTAVPGLILAPLVTIAGGLAGWLVAEIAYTELTGDGHLRHPAFVALREDKKAREVTGADRGGAP